MRSDYLVEQRESSAPIHLIERKSSKLGQLEVGKWVDVLSQTTNEHVISEKQQVIGQGWVSICLVCGKQAQLNQRRSVDKQECWDRHKDLEEEADSTGSAKLEAKSFHEPWRLGALGIPQKFNSTKPGSIDEHTVPEYGPMDQEVSKS